MTTAVTIAPSPILAFLDNNGRPCVGGSVLTQVGGVNAATYQDSGGTIPLPNPIPLNNRGEISNASGVSCQLFLATGTAYTFTLFDANGNQLNQASYVAAANPLIALASSIGSSLIGFIQAGIGAVLRTLQAELRDEIKVKQFGAAGDDVTDDTAAIQAAHDAIVTGGKARVLKFQNGATYKITNTIYIDVSLVSLSGDGATIDISAVPTGVPAFVFASSGTNGPSMTQALVTRGFRFVGSSVAGQICHQFGTLTNVHGLVATTPVSSVTIAECGFINIDICDQYVTQAIDIKHALCEYESCGASSEIINIPTGGTNYGENLTYSQCSFRNGGIVLNQIYTSSQINFSQCTFDYCTSFLRLLNGYCIAENCYFEMSADTLNHFVAYNDSLLILINPVISVTTNRVNTDVFLSNTNLSTGFNKGQGLRSGIFVQGGSIAFQGQNNRPFLCTGTGACEFVGIDYSGYALSQSATQKNCISAYTNLVNNGAFNANITGWTVAGGVTWNSSGGNGGGGSLQLNYTVDPTNAYVDFIVGRGQSVIVTYDVSTALASRYLQASILLFDYDGNQLATSYAGSIGEDEFTGTNAYTTCQTRYCNAPQGTAKGRFFLSLTGGAVSGCIANIDNVVVNVV